MHELLQDIHRHATALRTECDVAGLEQFRSELRGIAIRLERIVWATQARYAGSAAVAERNGE